MKMPSKFHFGGLFPALRRFTAGPLHRRAVRPAACGILAALIPLLLSATLQTAQAKENPIPIDDKSFKCLNEMVKVRHFYVDNLLGNRAATVAVATRDSGTYPPGSVVQLIPGEVMVKQPQGFNDFTHDWEFFELDVSAQGSKIRKRGFADVNNRFGGNCFGCHASARPGFDMICELDHGCAPIPVTRKMIAALQHTDPRCPGSDQVSADDKKSLEELGEAVKTMMKANGADAGASGASAKNSP
jgi:hypothetical protein